MRHSKIDMDLLMERHRALLEYQRKIAPFTPTVREAADVFCISSSNGAALILSNMVDLGLAISRQRGKYKKEYYAVETESPHVALGRKLGDKGTGVQG